MRSPSLTGQSILAAMPALHVILWLVLLCGTVPSLVQTLEENTCSTNCTCCINNTCIEDVVCEKDCKQGFHGINCTEPCPSGCATCPRMFNENSTCSKCKTGLYGDTCHLNCSPGCQNSKCDKETGVCSHGCVENYTGDQCCTKEGNCSKCSSPSQCEICHGILAGDRCELCKIGYHGNTCNKECKNCKENTCDKASGNCTYGCSGNFAHNRKGLCKRCNPGYWSSLCDEECPINCNNRCKRAGVCFNCPNGWYGKFCNITCPTNCKNKTCKQNYGACLDGCRENFDGEKCEKCVPGRFGENCEKECRNCKKQTCNKISGKCRSGCETSFYWTYCNQSCPDNCKNHIGDTVNGSCVQRCHPNTYTGDKCCLNHGYCKQCSTADSCAVCMNGFYGNKCRHHCSSHCNGAVCTRMNGHCPGGCRDGYTGDMCCLKNGHCQNCKSATECIKCKPGYFGDSCNNTCPSGCMEDMCDKTTGVCSDGCKSGFTGDKCCQKDGYCRLCTSSYECKKCQGGYFGNDCNNLCSNGCLRGKCDRNTSSCPCKHGYSGDKCCVSNNNCLVCSSTSQCSQCKGGFYGNACEHPCPMKCSVNSCEKHKGTCNACESGYYGSYCDMRCPEKCKDSRCHINGTCSACKRGYYRSDCKLSCLENCANNECRMDGTCLQCTSGFHGKDCSMSCSNTCINNTCYRNGTCVKCKAGFYGNLCKYKCQENCYTCVSETQCSECKKGFHGEDCWYTCPRNCLTCTNGSYCNICKGGYYGYTCNKTCSWCKDGTFCRPSDGFCLIACEDGYTSVKCNRKCHSNCRTCDRNNPAYCTACADGRFGHWYTTSDTLNISYCTRKCSVNCHSGLCDERTGHCFNCTGSFQGDRCGACREPLANPDKDCKCRKDICLDELTCSSCSNSSWYPDARSLSCCPCSNACINNRCSDEGECTHGCVDGYYGNRCEWKCSDRHEACEICSIDTHQRYICEKCRNGFYPTKNQCTQCSDHCLNGKCDSTNGRCIDGCIGRFWGMKCGQKCGQFCNGGKCDLHSGHCTAGCISGHWGETCDKTCGRFCVNKTCDRSNGQCVEGCENGHWGEMCDKGCGRFCANRTCDRSSSDCLWGCENGYWGETCIKTCGHFCVNRTCDRSSGHCVEGCETGHWGNTCNGTCVNHCEVCVNDAECVRCEAGRYWKDCSCNCSRGCARVKGKLVCDINDGSCAKGCRNERVFGKQCDLDCSENCIGSECEWMTGKCRRGCVPGLYGEFCNNTCADTCMLVQHAPMCYDTNGTCMFGCLNGFYGDMCRDECSRHCINGTCDQDSGSCLHGCRPGHRGANCSIALSATGPDDHLISLVVPVIAVLLLVGLLAAVVVAVIWNSRHTRRVKTERHVPRDNDATLHEEPVLLVDLDHAATNDDAVVYANAAGPCTRIPVAGLLDYVVNMSREDYAEIYQTLPKGLIKPYQYSQKPESVSRNRYKTIYPYDFSRVKLERGNNDYINASFINGYKRQKEYIASLGPLAKTTENFAIFWQMIWEQNVEKIVMLTNLQESSGMKCEQYWPNAGTTINYDVINVSGRNDDVYADYLMVTKGNETREVYHLHYIAWPDKTIPDDVISLLDFRNVNSGLPTKLGGSMVVHCSAGIGRTATYIGLDILCRQIEQEDSVDVYGCVMTMRENRVGMVQTAEQYMFLHRAFAVYVTLGYQPIRSECFSEYVSVLDDERLQRMFANLEACRSLIDVETAAIDRNRQTGTNRACADIPGDKYRVRIRLERQHGASSDYVNAVYLNSYAATNRYIVAQTPGQEGEEDFLALVLQERCSVIIDLDPVTSSDDGWMSLSANKRRSKVNNFHISCSLMTASQKFSQRQLRHSLEGQFKEWEKDASVPESPEDFVGFIRGVESAYRKFPENGPILLHCGSAGGRSCLFYVVAMAIQRIETEHEVSVLSTVHQTRARRRGAIPNKEQLLFCYQCVDAYLQSYETYSNFVA